MGSYSDYSILKLLQEKLYNNESN